MRISDRYASAVHSSSLKSELGTYQSDTDVLGAYGLAGKRNPLATALERLSAGDGKATREIVSAMAAMSWGKAKSIKIRQTRVQSEDMARMVLAWHRNGTCKACGGHGYEVVPGTKTISDTECKVCHGSGKIPFERQFKPAHRELARWLLVTIEKEQAVAGPAALRALAPRVDNP